MSEEKQPAPRALATAIAALRKIAVTGTLEDAHETADEALEAIAPDACRTCGGTGTLVIPDSSYESASEQACPDCGPEPECLASHCPPSATVDCEYPKCAPLGEESRLEALDAQTLHDSPGAGPVTAPDRPGTPDGRSTPKPLGQVAYEATQAYWNRHQAHISEPWDTLPQASQEAAETGAQAVAARLTDGYAAELAAENAKLRERLVMLLADTPFEFQPDWTPEYEDEIAKRQESASWPN